MEQDLRHEFIVQRETGLLFICNHWATERFIQSLVEDKEHAKRSGEDWRYMRAAKTVVIKPTEESKQNEV